MKISGPCFTSCFRSFECTIKSELFTPFCRGLLVRLTANYRLYVLAVKKMRNLGCISLQFACSKLNTQHTGKCWTGRWVTRLKIHSFASQISLGSICPTETLEVYVWQSTLTLLLFSDPKGGFCLTLHTPFAMQAGEIYWLKEKAILLTTWKWPLLRYGRAPSSAFSSSQ